MDPNIRQGGNQSQTPTIEISHSHSINTIPSLHPDYIISEEMLAGQQLDGRMSSVRRFFCMFVTFDLLFTSLMWLICVMLNGENIMKALDEQVYHYNIQTSLFDIVMTAICRFIILLLFYAFIRMNHWIIVAITTTLTCAVLLAKVFLYDWPHSSQQVFEVLLVLASFILAWGEAWFLDFRVLPQESYARRYLITNPDTERTPLIRSYVNGLPSVYTESVGNFYSPMNSPEGSMYKFNEATTPGRYPSIRLTQEQEENYVSSVGRAMQVAWDLLHKNDWKHEKSNEDGSVYTMTVPDAGKIFKLTAVIEISPKFLLEELFDRVENIPKWNPALLESHKVQVINERTDITYQIAADGPAGVVSSRDFVTLRQWDCFDDCYIIAYTGTDHPSVPTNEKYVRGENGAGCWVMQTNPTNPSICVFQWVFNANLNLKGWIPQYIRDTALISMLLDYSKNLKQHVTKLRATRAI